MAEPFISEIRLMSFNFAPSGWALCNGQILPVNQNQALFSLLGTAYGGNGRSTFALPDLRGRTPIHAGNNHSLGERGGEQVHTLSLSETPVHTHALNASPAAGNSPAPASPRPNVLGKSGDPIYTSPANLVAMNAGTVESVGGNHPHLNMQPYLTLNFCIALQGIFPSQS